MDAAIDTTNRALPAPGPAEATEIHTRILRISLAIEESRSYWEHVDPAIEPAHRALIAFEQRWFGSKSLERVRFLVSSFVERYDAFPEALGVLRRWRSMDATTRRMICHVHTQLSDPLYRRFTGALLVDRRAMPEPSVNVGRDSASAGRSIDRDVTLRWLKRELPDRWAEATLVQFASKLLSAASEAGLISPRRDPRAILAPKVTDQALAYLLYLLRGARFSGTLLDNPYLASVGLTQGLLDQRLRALPGLTFRRMAHLTEIDWDAPSLSAWAEGVT